MDYFQRGSSSVTDTLSKRDHSLDFSYARNQYLGSRLKTVCWIFLVLSPFWALFDQFLLPQEILPEVRVARLVFFFCLVVILMLTRWRALVNYQVALAIVLILIPACFYAFLLFITNPYQLPNLANYYFIPFLLVATLSIFPFTLSESLTAGFFILMVQLYSCFNDPSASIYFHLQEIWLLAALLTVSITANHFHLSLLLRLYRQATHDQLTGLMNRHALLNLMTKGNETATLNDVYGILLLDLDRFKKINDDYGHAIGDKILQAFANLLKKHSQTTDYIARYGGEEFLIITKISNSKRLKHAAEEIRKHTETMTVSDLTGQPVGCTVSIGASIAQQGETLQTAIQRADEALYHAKRSGRNQVALHTQNKNAATK